MLLPKEGTSSVSFLGVEVATRIERNGMIVEMILLWGELLSRKRLQWKKKERFLFHIRIRRWLFIGNSYR